MKKFGLLIVILALAYCTWGALFGPLMFDVMVWNTSKLDYNNVRVRFERFDFQFGVLSEKTWAVYSQQIGPWPESITVSWIVRGKPEQTLTEEIKLAKPLVIQSNESLELIVEFKDGGPVAYPRARGDESIRWRRRYKD
jgi:hypothetical protein